MSREVLAVPALHFQRSDGPVRVKKPVRKSPLRFVHVLTIVAGIGLLFFGFTRLYGFLLTWDNLNVRTAVVVCSDPKVLEIVRPMAASVTGGNILLLDAPQIKAGLEACPWVKEAHVRKVFPSSLAVDITPRLPAAVIDGGNGYLLGRDNVLIESAGPGDRERLPVIHDDGMFAADREAKLSRAWACWDDLKPETQARIAELDVTDPDDITATFRDDPVKLRLGLESYAGKIATYMSGRDRWTRDLGRLEYVDLRFSDRIYLKAVKEEAL